MRVTTRSTWPVRSMNIEDLSLEVIDDLIEGLKLMKRVQAMHRDTHQLLDELIAAKTKLEEARCLQS